MKKKYIIFDFNWTLLDDKTKEFFEWVPELLKELSKRYKLFLSSQSDDEAIKDFLKKEWVYEYFDIVFGSSVMKKWPKHVEVFNLYLDDRDFENRTIYVWDSEFDREIAKEAWISFVKIWKEWKDYYEIDKITDLKEFISKVK